MGDVLHAMPAVAALRELHPEWLIGWAIEPAWRELLQAESEIHDVAWRLAGRGAQRPLVDRWYPVPTREWKRRPLSLNTLAGDRRAAAGAARRPVRSLRRYAGVDPVGGGGADGWGGSVCRGCEAAGGSGGVVLRAEDQAERGACGGAGLRVAGRGGGRDAAAREGDVAGGSCGGAMVRCTAGRRTESGLC